MSQHIARTERLALCDTFEAVGPDAPTLCMPWTTRDLAAHLVIRERRPDLAPGMLTSFLKARTDREQASVAAQPWSDLIEVVRSGPPNWHPTRIAAIDNAMNFSEMVVHHEDVLRGDGQPGPRREVTTHLEAAIWSHLSQLGRVLFRRAPDGVELHTTGRATLPVRGGDAPVIVTGEPLELLLTAYGRRGVAQIEVSGDDAAVERFATAQFGL